MDTETSINLKWEQIKKYLLKDETTKRIHKMIWEDFAVITDTNGTRYKITAENTFIEIKQLVYSIVTNSVYNKPESIKYASR